MKKLNQYSMLSSLFFYPGKDYKEKVISTKAFLDDQYPEASKELVQFMDFIDESPIIDIQELYIRSFDVQSVTTLDLGYVMFGDDYKRGALLVNLTRELRDAGIDDHGELADHLPNVLLLLDKMKEENLLEEMVEKIVLPAAEKIINSFNPGMIERKNNVYKKHHKTILETSVKYATVFEEPLKALLKVLKADFNVEAYRPPEISTDFLASIKKEIELEPSK